MIYNYFRWLNLPYINRYKVNPVEKVRKEFPLQKQEHQEEDQEKKPRSQEKEEHKVHTRLSIWV